MRGINRRMQSSAVDYLSAIADRKPINLSTCFLLLWIISSSVLQAHGYFMYDSKAVLDGCHEYWTFQNRERIPLLFQMTVCVDVRVTSPGHWLAFSYISPRSPRYDLALEGDPHSLYAWLLGVRHRFPVELQLQRWHRLCLRRDSLRNTFSLEVEGSAEAHRRTVIARVIPPHGALTLGCRPEDATPGTTRGKVELYLFRMWGDVGQHEKCEDGTVAGWESRLWSITHSRTRVRDDLLYCGKRRRKRSNSGTTTNGAREFASTPATTSDRSTTTPPPLTTPPRTTQTSHVGTISATVPTAKATTASTLTPTSKKITAASTTSKETQHPHGGQGSSPSPFTASSQQTGTEGVNSTYAHPSTHPTFSPSSPSPTMTFDPENTATTAFTVADPTPTEGSQNTSHSTYPHMTATTEPKQVTGTTSVTTLPATTPRYSTNSTTSPTSRTLMASHSTADQWSTPDTGQIVMQCNFSQFCSNTTSHYWMLVSVNVSRGMKTEADIKAWFSLLNYSITHDESTEVNCADKTNIRRTNCTVLLQLSKPMSTCDLRHLLQERGDGDDIHVTILGQVERVGG